MERNVLVNTKTLTFFASALVGTLLYTSVAAHAGGPIPLTDGQLDRLTAGSAIVFSNVDAQAIGLKAYSSTLSNSILGTNPSVENGFGSEGGTTSGVAVAWGLNPLGNSAGAPPPASSTNVTTGGGAQGNFTLMIAGGGTSSALGQTIQVGVMSVYGVFVPGL
jgi:hypothetical protein